MEEKFSEKTIQEVKKKNIGEAMTEATLEIRGCMFQALQRLEKEYPSKKFFFTGKYVESFDPEEDLSNLPF